jgi:hypothetical protein
VSAVALDEMDTRVLSGCRDGVCMLWSLVVPKKGESGEMGLLAGPEHILHGHTTEVTALAICTEADLALTAATDATCNIHTVRKGQFLRTLSPDPDGPSMFDERLAGGQLRQPVHLPAVHEAEDEERAVETETVAVGAAMEASQTNAAAAAAEELLPPQEVDLSRWSVHTEQVLLTNQGTCVVHTIWQEQNPATPDDEPSQKGRGSGRGSAGHVVPPPAPGKRRKRYCIHVYSCNGHLLSQMEEPHKLTNMCSTADGDRLVTVNRHGHVTFLQMQT